MAWKIFNSAYALWCYDVEIGILEKWNNVERGWSFNWGWKQIALKNVVKKNIVPKRKIWGGGGVNRHGNASESSRAILECYSYQPFLYRWVVWK